jgi:hypothetical protein
MKRLIFSLAFGLLLSFGLSAQIELRPSIGTTYNSIKDSRDFEHNGKYAFSFGADVMLGGKLYVQPGLHYKGTINTLKPKDIVIGDEAEVKVSRLEIPLIVGVRYASFGVANFRAFTGPSLSFLLNVDDDGSPYNITKADYKNATLGWNAGLGVDVLFLFLDIGYQFGLSDTYDDFSIQGIEIENTNHNFWYGNVGLRLKI